MKNLILAISGYSLALLCAYFALFLMFTGVFWLLIPGFLMLIADLGWAYLVYLETYGKEHDIDS